MKKFADQFANNPVHTVHVSSFANGSKTLRTQRKQFVHALRKDYGLEVDNYDNEAEYHLTTLQDNVVDNADAFVFLPLASSTHGHIKRPAKVETLREQFKAASLFVGLQTSDPKMRLTDSPKSPLKPVIIVNSDGAWDEFKEMVDHLHENMRTITQNPEDVFTFVKSIGGAIEALKSAARKKTKSLATHPQQFTFSAKEIAARQHDPKAKRKPDFNVCVFCSASTRRDDLIQMSEELGRDIAHEGWGLISGMGSSGMMGGVVRGSAEVIRKEGRGWIGGSNLERILNMEGLPDYYDTMWLETDIYKRMHKMIEESQAFIIMPGGMGTVQELFALLLLKHVKDNQAKEYLMRDKQYGNKPIIIVNPTIEDTHGEPRGVWDPLIKLAKNYGFEKDFKEVETAEEAATYLKRWEKNRRPNHEPRAASVF